MDFKGQCFYVGKIYCLRGGEEQRALKSSQFQRLTNPDRLLQNRNSY